MGYYFDDSRDYEDRPDKDYIGKIDGFTYTGYGTYSNNNGGSDLYVVKNDDGTISSCREM